MVMWEDPLDKFRISKSYAVVDIDEFIQAMRGAENLSESGIEMMLQDLHHDVAQTGRYSPYEEEAVHFAIFSGAVGKDVAETIMRGPGTFGYNQAFNKAFEAGFPLVNRAAEEQNAMNRGQHNPAPLPFTPAGQLNPAYAGDVRSTVAEQTGGKNRRNRKSTDFNPFDKNNRLVNHIVSSRHADPYNPESRGAPVEGFSRWYEPAAKKLGYLPTDYNSKTGKAVDRFEFLVPAHFVHKNTITLNDRRQRNHIINRAKQFIDQGLSDNQVRAALLDDPMAFRHTSIMHHNPDSIHDMVRTKEQRMTEFRDGLIDDELDPRSVSTPGDPVPHESILHPNMQDISRYSNANSVRMAVTTNSKRMLKDLMDHHGMSEDDAKELMSAVAMGSKGGLGDGNARKRLLRGLYRHHTKDGNIPEFYTGQPMTFGEKPISGTPEAPKEDTQPIPEMPPPVPSGPRTPPAAPPLEGNPIIPAPATTGDSLPPPITGQPGITEGNQDIPSTPRPDLSGITREGLARVLARVASTPASTQMREGARDIGAGARTFTEGIRGLGRTMLGKSEVEMYLETVQYELAKTVIEDYTDIGKMDIGDPVHIALVGSHIQRSTSDVISIYHTKGDWRNIAKSFGLNHEQVQMVKVAFHE
tara:strand:- start:20527 stop:22446 length:1920 start_codon:yes stop_codon:yes gene_type:complete